MVHVNPPDFFNGSNSCPDPFNCDGAFDFSIKRHDTKPPFKVKVVECDGQPMDLTGLILEASMWFKARLKRDIATVDEYFALSDNVGFDQCKIGDIIVMDRVRAPEQMLIIGFDETLKYIQVQRGYNGSLVLHSKKVLDCEFFVF
jgi:hypothetical protein